MKKVYYDRSTTDSHWSFTERIYCTPCLDFKWNKTFDTIIKTGNVLKTKYQTQIYKIGKLTNGDLGLFVEKETHISTDFYCYGVFQKYHSKK